MENKEYEALKQLVTDRIYQLESANQELRIKLSVAQAKLEVYERLISISDSKISLGFETPMRKEDNSYDNTNQ